MTEFTKIEIFPPIGVARVGDSPNEFFFAPEVPGRVSTMPFDSNGQRITQFRDAEGKIKRQATRFRVYGYDQNNQVQELTTDGGYEFKWKVHAKNIKAASYLFRGRLRPDSGALRNPDVDRDAPTIYDRRKLIIDPGEQSIDTREDIAARILQGRFQGSLPDNQGVDVYLGELRLDNKGRLIFLGGQGRAGHVEHVNSALQPDIISEFDSTDWFDDTCEGWVDVEVTHANWPASKVPTYKSTILSGVPKFVWNLRPTISLYDHLEDVYNDNGSPAPQTTEFYRDIWPVLEAAANYAWVNPDAHLGHGVGSHADFLQLENRLANPNTTEKELREHVFSRVRQPGNPDHANTRFMPRLSGDDGDAIEPGSLALATIAPRDPVNRFSVFTKVQYKHFENWRDGSFTLGTKWTTLPDQLEDNNLQDQPALVTRAALEQCVAEAFYPGMEVYWIIRDQSIFKYGTNLSPPFRFDYDKIKVGDLTKGLSLPWQSDYDLCNTHWWPSARPDTGYIEVGTNVEPFKWTRGLRESPNDLTSYPGSTDMVRFWNLLGFIVPDNGRWLEKERLLL